MIGCVIMYNVESFSPDVDDEWKRIPPKFNSINLWSSFGASGCNTRRGKIMGTTERTKIKHQVWFHRYSITILKLIKIVSTWNILSRCEEKWYYKNSKRWPFEASRSQRKAERRNIRPITASITSLWWVKDGCNWNLRDSWYVLVASGGDNLRPIHPKYVCCALVRLDTRRLYPYPWGLQHCDLAPVLPKPSWRTWKNKSYASTNM